MNIPAHVTFPSPPKFHSAGEDEHREQQECDYITPCSAGKLSFSDGSTLIGHSNFTSRIYF
jgi:hypothetical protein